MNGPRWLVPFTYGVDMQALDLVVSLAGSARATLVPVSLISVLQEGRSRGARLEHIQQSKDFLEALQFKAARLKVPVERYEVFTGDVLQSIAVLVRDLDCDSIVLVTTGNRDVLLHASELKGLLMEPPASLVLIRQPGRTQNAPAWHPGDRLLSWLRRLRGYQDDGRHMQDAPTGGEPSWIRVEEPHRG